jgi:hypothetical protein
VSMAGDGHIIIFWYTTMTINVYQVRIRGCINHVIMNVVWFLRKVFRTVECSWLLPIIRTLRWDQREMMTCRSMSAVVWWEHWGQPIMIMRYWKAIPVKVGWGEIKDVDNFRMNTRYGRYGAAYNMIGLRCFNEELCCCQRIQQRQSYKLRVHGVNPQSPLKV